MTAGGILAGQVIHGWDGTVPAAVVRDSRCATPASWLCVVADGATGAEHASQARAAGAAVVARRYREAGPSDWRVGDPRQAFARADAATRGLAGVPVVGVTGTDGKTSVTWWLQAALGAGAARVGTLGWHDGYNEQTGRQTTPPPEAVHGFVAQLAARPGGCPGLAIECSSHAGDQHRLAGITLRGLVISAITGDHLDYHHSHAAYRQAKARLLRLLAGDAVVVVDADDSAAVALGAVAHARGLTVIELGVTAGGYRLHRDQETWILAGPDWQVPLPVRQPGAFNAWNVAAALLQAAGLGIDLTTASARIAAAPAIPGRLEPCADNPLTFVDYAHTAAALERVLAAVRATWPQRRLVCVFGAGGDRDPTKRAPMGRAAMTADEVVITNDNPRSESPAAIAAAIASGCDAGRYQIELDRGAAIRLARKLAGSDGVVVVCGKGHETEQIIGDQRLPWDDRAAIRLAAGAPV